MTETLSSTVEEKAIESLLGASEKLIIAAADMLSTDQQNPDRNYQNEEFTARLARRMFQAVNTDKYETGVKCVEAEGITYEYIPRRWFRDSRNPDKIRQIKPISGGLSSCAEKKVDGNFPVHGFARGDKLGHKELVDKWYLVIGIDKIHYIPVAGLKNIDLRVISIN